MGRKVEAAPRYYIVALHIHVTPEVRSVMWSKKGGFTWVGKWRLPRDII